MYNIFNKVNILLYWKLIVIIIFLISLFLFISLFSYIYTAILKNYIFDLQTFTCI